MVDELRLLATHENFYMTFYMWAGNHIKGVCLLSTWKMLNSMEESQNLLQPITSTKRSYELSTR